MDMDSQSQPLPKLPPVEYAARNRRLAGTLRMRETMFSTEEERQFWRGICDEIVQNTENLLAATTDAAGMGA